MKKPIIGLAIVIIMSLSFEGTTCATPINVDFNSLQVTYNGNAFYDTVNGYAVSTPNLKHQRGSIWYNTPFDISQFSVSFDFYVGSNPSGADGITFAVIDTINGLNALGSDGGNLGYGGINPSFAVEFDTYVSTRNNWDPPGNEHVGIDKDGSMSSIVTNTLQSTLEDGLIHTADVFYSSGNIQVYLDGSLKISTSISPAFSQGYLGFTGGTGASSNLQYVANWTINPAPVPEPASLLLLGSGLLGLAGIRKRKAISG